MPQAETTFSATKFKFQRNFMLKGTVTSHLHAYG